MDWSEENKVNETTNKAGMVGREQTTLHYQAILRNFTHVIQSENPLKDSNQEVRRDQTWSGLTLHQLAGLQGEDRQWEEETRAQSVSREAI